MPAVERASAVTFLAGDRLSRRVSEPEIVPRSPEESASWIERMLYLQSADPDGCWVAVDGDEVVGFAISQNRGGMWYLATYGVLPGRQGCGTGKQLMDAVLGHAAGRPGMFCSTVHPGATRRYGLAGFRLLPQMRLVGRVDRGALPEVAGLREGCLGDVAWMDQLDERLRGAGHGSDHEYMLRTLRLVVTRERKRPGYVYLDNEGNVSLLAAESESIAESLLWEALASSHGGTLVKCITSNNHWALDVGLAARLSIGQEGYLAVRGGPEPAPYLPSGHFL